MNDGSPIGRNIEAMKKERARLAEQNGKDFVAYQEVVGGDVYDRHQTHNNSARIKELDALIKSAEETQQREIAAKNFENRINAYEREQKEMEEYYANAKYSYTAGTEQKKTNNHALAARYDAQHRFFGMSKTKQALAKMTGQWKKFNKLWNKATDIDLSPEEQEEIAGKLDSMFKR